VENTVVHDHHKNGWMTFAKSFSGPQHRDDQNGQQLAPAKLAWYLNAFGFGQKTDVCDRGTAGLTQGTPRVGPATRASMPWAKMGDPLAVVMAVAAIATEAG